MYYFLSLLTGILITVMVVFNGELTGQYGIYFATVIIHIAGLLLITAVVLIRRDKVFAVRYPAWLYLGGAIGVMTTVFNNLAFGRISVSAILALGLLGQSAAGLTIDQFGFFGMQKHPFTKGKLVGLFLIIGGIGIMVDNLEIVAVAVSFAAGVNIVLSRTLNAKLSNLTNVRVGTFFNYFVGLGVAAIVLLILGRGEAVFAAPIVTSWWIYFGGVLGVCVVLISNITVVKISAFYLTLLIFIGKIFSGVLIDVIISNRLSLRNLTGGILVTIGLCVNLLMDRRKSYSPSQPISASKL
ncbi:MAG: DMT family transporter [Firmicutes bacterium]|nr:DMT family transporter [Bacillota bacterium]